MSHAHDVAVIGAGVVGLALADALLEAHPRLRVVVLEKEARLGAHASGRNSGVIHAGFYYSPDSLKARLTRRGNVLLHEFCDDEGIPVRRCGKLVVAHDEHDVAALDELLARGRANGVPLDRVDEARARELEPLARTVQQALWSPTTSSASPYAVLNALASRVRRRGAEIWLGYPVTTARPGVVVTPRATLHVSHIVNAGGLQADRIAGWFGMSDDYVMLPFKGLYWYAMWAPGRLRSHVYPVPDARNPFLGVHFTVGVDGRVKLGPTATPALFREHYGRLHGVSPRDAVEVLRSYPALLRSEHHDIPALIRAELPKYSRRYLVRRARRLVPSIRAKDFSVRAESGIRAQLLHLPSGRLEMDFVVRGDDRSTHVLNAVSPAWTSSLAMAEHVSRDVMPRLG